MSDKAPEPGLPARIGRYEIQRPIGRGMMGVVYQAHDTVLRRTVALKTISLAFATTDKERQTFERRFLEEARAAAALTHPGIVVVYDFGTDARSNLLYMALEYLRGKTLEAVLAEGRRLDWRETLKTSARIADALHHAHQHRVVHRDVKPANIMVLGSGEPKIMDFGVAKVDTAQLSTSGQVFGSPSYMSPEQVAGETVDARTDVFALGAVLHELLTGQKAFPGKDLAGIVMKVLNEEPPPVTSLVDRLPADLGLVVARALAKSRDRRYATAKALAEDLEDVVAGRPPRHTAGPRVKGPTTLAGPHAGSPPATALAESTLASGRAASALALPSGRRVSVSVVEGAQWGRVFTVDQPRTVIGRAGANAGADIELADPETSRTHAVIECHGQHIVLRDLGSTNGTFLGEQRITDAPLDDGAEFRIGRTRLRLSVKARN